jgi:7-carboxy-7-deazaguanine synthase (Cx14CxxC type)
VSYVVKELFHTLQGEGANSGRAAVFCRFAGCNLWSGREQDRSAAACDFCDTDFIGSDGPGGGRFGSATELAAAVTAQWPGGGDPLVVCTGGEPLLQLNDALIEALHTAGFSIAVETNGTRAPPGGSDGLGGSPPGRGGRTSLVQRSGDELKLVYPQPGVDPEDFSDLQFDHFFLQPMAGRGDDCADATPAAGDVNTARCVDYCLTHPRWRLSLQIHKLLGIP